MSEDLEVRLKRIRTFVRKVIAADGTSHMNRDKALNEIDQAITYWNGITMHEQPAPQSEPPEASL